MTNIPRELLIYRGDEKVAYLFEQGTDNWQLVYDNNAGIGRSVSVRFPFREQAYCSQDVRAFFRNLLPAPQLCRMATRQFGFTPGNDFALVGELCAETVGAVAIRTSEIGVEKIGQLREINDEELRNIFAAMAFDPLLTRIEGYRTSLPGGHPKIAVRLHDNQVCLPLGDELSTHVIKPASEDRRESLENESYCMSLAAALGLPVVNASLVHGVSNYLLLERFDRVMDNDQPSCVHAEDFCQLALLQPENGFQREGGLSAVECVDLIRAYSVQPAVDIKRFLHWLIFNFLIGNGHATAKQLTLIHSSDGPKLGPFYGLSSTHVYPQMNPNLAMNLGAEARPDWMIPARWREFAKSAGIRPKYLLGLLENLSAELVTLIPDVEASWQQLNGYAEIISAIRKMIEQRARQLVVSLQAEAA